MVIDLVVPYVDSEDPSWQKLFDQYNPKVNEEGIDAKNRFRGQGDFFRYFFRCVERNLPFINNIYLVVQSDSQVPKWINRKNVKIVYHKDIIPEEYLPTFNSTCIEMFIWKIEELSEYFLYANDDIFAFNRLTEDKFFKDNKVRNSTRPFGGIDTMYGKHCVNSYCIAQGKDKEEYLKKNNIVPSFGHRIRPYLKSKCKEAFEKNKKIILDSLTKFRDSKNINMYFFDHYLIKNGYQTIVEGISNRVLSSKYNYKDILNILNSKPEMLAIQDTDPNNNIYENYTIRNWFASYYGNKSKYEV